MAQHLAALIATGRQGINYHFFRRGRSRPGASGSTWMPIASDDLWNSTFTRPDRRARRTGSSGARAAAVLLRWFWEMDRAAKRSGSRHS
jgi:hypothetical protein